MQQANNRAKPVEQEAKSKSTEAAPAQGMWIRAYALLLQPLLTKRKAHKVTALLPPAAAKLLMVVLSRYADRPVLTTLQR